MDSLQALLDAPDLRPLLRRIAGPDSDAPVRRIALVEDLGRLGDLDEATLAVLTHAASQDAASYRLDVALRTVGSRNVSAIVLTDGREEIAPTAAALARRVSVAVLRARAGCDLAALLLALHRELAGGPDVALARIRAALRALERHDARPETLLRAATQALGAPVELREPGPDDIAAPVVVFDEVEATVSAPRGNGHGEAAADVVVHLAAAAVARARTAARQAEDAPIRSRGELISEFLLARPDHGDRLLERMRAAGLTIDGWHTAILIDIENLPLLAAEDELASLRLSDRVATLGLEAARASGGVWHRARLGSGLLLTRMERHDLGSRGGRDAVHAAGQILRRILSRIPEIALVCGVGSTHVGATGLRTTLAEARAALAAGHAGHRVNVPTGFDEVGLQRTLIEWFASDTAREAVDSLLRPLDALGPQRCRTALQTLRVYLDNQGSTTRAAAELHLHRNAIAYRVRRIFELLDVDPEDPDTVLMLQLACRARSLG
ncbi:PucR family transcriptional regulator [Pseudonocardia bannensis]|uniref:PucR family transcriptional regulator n=1 Tax=Pseudonocardia bannensis TaxID=630973 RepID=A0A848DJ17_9PSEU|nr:helix-turn-helix domain-containing protein [Pseudonocardia bannensis]NMH92565.1 PucR family transcriptional regulator [Pseudonocardia bannensis]